MIKSYIYRLHLAAPPLLNNSPPLLDPSTDEVALIIGRTFILTASAVSKITPADAAFIMETGGITANHTY
ncbi:hypothetical protein L4D77_06760 [Photobacterium frigidiphilum]|uniref:hypothetical protein n=1 Tax=Photobacterium frigidiphilum TaxID=264736 RepID=UPI003D1096CE